jgi:hypothetical protein
MKHNSNNVQSGYKAEYLPENMELEEHIHIFGRLFKVFRPGTQIFEVFDLCTVILFIIPSCCSE